MKHLLISASLCALVSLTGWSADFKSGGLNYTITDATAKTVSVAKYDDNASRYTGDIVIPSTVTNDGTTYTVTGIDASAFYWCTIPSVTFPTTLKTIGAEAFYGCGQLAKADLPQGIETLGKSCFERCFALTDIVIPGSMKSVGYAAYELCSNLKTIVMEEGVESTSGYAFYGSCKNVTKLQFPSTFTRVGDNSFASNEQLTELILPDGITYIGTNAFADFKKLIKIHLPANLKTLADGAFKRNISLASLEIPEGVTMIGASCFYQSAISAITIPDGVQNIQKEVFWKCPNLATVNMGKGVKIIQTNAFTQCPELSLINMAPETPPTAVATAFDSLAYETAKVVVSPQALSAYKAADVWKDFKNLSIPAAKENCVEVTYTGPERLELTPDAVIPVLIKNTGSNEVNSIEYTVSIDGMKGEYSLDDIAIPAYTNVPYEFPASLVPVGKHTIVVDITKVNGVENAADKKQITISLEVYQTISIPEDAQKATYSSLSDIDTFGSSTSYDHYEGALLFNDPNLVGWKVVGLEIMGMEKTGFKNHEIWYSADGLTSANRVKAITPLSVDVLKGAFDTPYTLTEKGLYLGFSMDRATESGSTWCIPCAQQQSPNNHCFYAKLGGNAFIDWSDYGTLPAIVYLEGPRSTNSMKIAAVLTPTVTMKGKSLKIKFTVQNYGTNEVNKFDYRFTVNDRNYTGGITLPTPLPAYLTREYTYSCTLPAIETPGNYPTVLTVRRVNGVDNQYQNDVIYFTKASVSFNYGVGAFQTTRRPLMEEYTGTGCPWCPRGTLGMTEMAKRVPEFIGVAYHRFNSSDPMYLKKDAPVKFMGAPSCMVDRNGLEVDPYYGDGDDPMGIETYYNAQKEVFASADMSLESITWDSEAKTMNVKGKLNFSYADPAKTYKMAYVMTVDSLSGTEASWKQSNTYEGKTSSDPLIASLCNGTFNLKVYNHVCFDNRDELGATSATWAGSSLKVNQEVPFEYTTSGTNWANPGDNPFKFDTAKNVHVVAILLDSDGRVINAIKGSATETGGSTGVSDLISGDNGQAEYYDLMGRRVQNPQNGIYIKVQGSHATKVAL